MVESSASMTTYQRGQMTRWFCVVHVDEECYIRAKISLDPRSLLRWREYSELQAKEKERKKNIDDRRMDLGRPLFPFSTGAFEARRAARQSQDRNATARCNDESDNFDENGISPRSVPRRHRCLKLNVDGRLKILLTSRRRFSQTANDGTRRGRKKLALGRDETDCSRPTVCRG